MNFSFLKKAVPFIATVASTAVPAAAPFIGMAAKLLSDGLGKDVKPTADAIAQAVGSAMANPEELAKLKEIDNNFAIQMQSLGISSAEEFEKIASADRADARAMQINTKSWIPAFLAISVTGGFFGLLGLMAYHALPPANEKVFDIMLGALSGAWIAVVNYYLGSSAGSARKTELLSQVDEKA